MHADAEQALRHLATLLGPRAAEAWLDGARVETTPAGGRRLHVRSAFVRQRLEAVFAAQLREALGDAVEIVACGRRPRVAAPALVLPRLAGAAGDYAVRMVRAFVDGGPAAHPLTVVSGPPHSGQKALLAWAAARGGRHLFRLDVARLRGGGSRGLVPRKPLLVAEGIEALAGQEGAQRTLCMILDGLRDRDARALVSLAGHPAEVEGFLPALRSRLLGGVRVRLEEPTRGDVRRQLRARARRRGQALAADLETELSALPPAAALRALDLRLDERTVDAPAPEHEALDRMKDLAAALLGVDRKQIDDACRRRGVVEARRAVMAAADRRGLPHERIAEAFRLKATRTVREACRWASREELRDRRFGALLHELGRVVPAE